MFPKRFRGLTWGGSSFVIHRPKRGSCLRQTSLFQDRISQLSNAFLSQNRTECIAKAGLTRSVDGARYRTAHSEDSGPRFLVPSDMHAMSVPVYTASSGCRISTHRIERVGFVDKIGGLRRSRSYMYIGGLLHSIRSFKLAG